jgi:betaine-aldehyde dehydrogenase
MASDTPSLEQTVRDHVSNRSFQLTIGGKQRGASGGAMRPVMNPSTGEHLADVPEASVGDVNEAIDDARSAQVDWGALDMRTRIGYLQRLASAVADNAEHLAMIDAIDAGNPIDEMRIDLQISQRALADWPAMGMLLAGTAKEASPGNLHYTRYEPYGVVGRIVAFNHPAMFAITRSIPPLLAGNSVVLKPGVQTPLAALAFGEIASRVLPPGVLNVVTGGAETGDAIVTSPHIKRIAFTGSVETGLVIQRRGAESGFVKHISLELGGKNAMVVFPDVDVATIVDAAVRGMNLEVCQGQSCSSTPRMFVHERIYDEFVHGVGERLRALRVGHAYDEQTDMGPLVSIEHRNRVMGFIADGVREGAQLVEGGVIPTDTPSDGYYLRPALFADVTMGMRIAREEIFGPVITVLPWRDLDDVVNQANELDLGLCASIWTHDIDLAHRVAHRLQAGYVWINGNIVHYWDTPFGGMKNSGLGREECLDDLKSFLETKAVHTVLRDSTIAYRELMDRLDGTTQGVQS